MDDFKLEQYEKCDDFDFPIINFPFAQSFCVYISKLIGTFVHGHTLRISFIRMGFRILKLLRQSYVKEQLKSITHKFNFQHHKFAECVYPHYLYFVVVLDLIIQEQSSSLCIYRTCHIPDDSILICMAGFVRIAGDAYSIYVSALAPFRNHDILSFYGFHPQTI